MKLITPLLILTSFAFSLSACAAGAGQLLCGSDDCATQGEIWIDKFSPEIIGPNRTARFALVGERDNCTVIALSKSQYNYIYQRSDKEGYSDVSVSGEKLNTENPEDADPIPMGQSYTLYKDRWVNPTLCPKASSILYATDIRD